MGYGGGGGGNLSRERKHRMRELATAKLSQAYHLDEIATSVATMQSASTLEDVAQFVLQRNPNDVDAKYVHFFHEKIPSRMMAQCTPLDTLDEIIAERPSDGSPWRTRALTRIFKEDYVNAARDLTEGLALARYAQAQHRAGKDQLVLATSIQEQSNRDWRQDIRVAEEDQPKSLETQLLFHRAGVYLTMACQSVHTALDAWKEVGRAKRRREAQVAAGIEPDSENALEQDARRVHFEARKQVRTSAKRALRDYMSLLSQFDYTPGLTIEAAEALLNHLQKDAGRRYSHSQDAFADASRPTSDALVPRRRSQGRGERGSWPNLPRPEVFKVSQLFEPAPPSSLPPYPASHNSSPPLADAISNETVTYHPLLTDSLHSLLLCHALVQTPPKEILRHAHNAARLARICDGYPIFLGARSPARADWIEVLRRAGNWIGLASSWEALCRPAPLPGQPGPSANGGPRSPADKTARSIVSKSGQSGSNQHQAPPPESDTQKRERQKKEAILEALSDERVTDEDSFQCAVRARQRRFDEDGDLDAAIDETGNSENSVNAAPNGASARPKTAMSPPAKASTAATPSAAPKRWAQDDSREYPISTERAEAISRWVREAPPPSTEGSTGVRKGRRKGRKKDAGLSSLSREGSSATGLEGSVETLSVADEVV
ncbi:hypothetical protein M011DRAFT_467288, partial [Sporormia fimetaria CBS 119925]